MVDELLKKSEIIREKLKTSDDFQVILLQTARLYHVYATCFSSNIEVSLDRKLEHEMWTAFKSLLTFAQQKHDKLTPFVIDCLLGMYQSLLHAVLLQQPPYLPQWKSAAWFGQIAPSSSSSKPCRPSSLRYLGQHLLSHMGDLERYRGMVDEARSLYQLSVRLLPGNGHPLNQLAILEQTNHSVMDALYYNIRSVTAKFSFQHARANLKRFLATAIQRTPSPNAKTARDFEHCVVHLLGHLLLNSDSSSPLSPRARQYVVLLEVSLPDLLVQRQFSREQLVRMVAVSLFVLDECHHVDFFRILLEHTVAAAKDFYDALPAIHLSIVALRLRVAEQEWSQLPSTVWHSLAELLTSFHLTPQELDDGRRWAHIKLFEEVELDGCSLVVFRRSESNKSSLGQQPLTSDIQDQIRAQRVLFAAQDLLQSRLVRSGQQVGPLSFTYSSPGQGEAEPTHADTAVEAYLPMSKSHLDSRSRPSVAIQALMRQLDTHDEEDELPLMEPSGSSYSLFPDRPGLFDTLQHEDEASSSSDHFYNPSAMLAIRFPPQPPS